MVLGVLTGWLDRREREAVAYLIEENRLLRRQLGSRRLRSPTTNRRRLAAQAAGAATLRLTSYPIPFRVGPGSPGVSYHWRQQHPGAQAVSPRRPHYQSGGVTGLTTPRKFVPLRLRATQHLNQSESKESLLPTTVDACRELWGTDWHAATLNRRLDWTRTPQQALAAGGSGRPGEHAFMVRTTGSSGTRVGGPQRLGHRGASMRGALTKLCRRDRC